MLQTNIQYSKEETASSGFRLYYDTTNTDYISSTSLLKLYECSKHLDAWKQRLGEEEANKVTQAAIQRGIEAHTTVENYQKDGIINTSDEYGSKAIESFLQYVNILYVEEPVFFQKKVKDITVRYAGRFDQIIEIPKKTFAIKREATEVYGTCLLDLKTKDKLPRYDKPDFIFKNCMQLASYYNALRESPIDLTGAVILYSTKKRSLILYLNKECLEFYWKCFKCLLLDYYYVKPLKYTWSDLCCKAELTFDRKTNTFTSYLPNVLYYSGAS